MDKETILTTLHILNGKVQFQKFRYGIDVNKCEWEIGIEVYKTIMSSLEFHHYSSDTAMEIMGWPVRINHQNPQIIKLWQEVEA